MQEGKVLCNEKQSRKGEKDLNGEDKILSAWDLVMTLADGNGTISS